MTDYPYIRAWGRLMHSADYYILDQVARARREGAPQNAIYRLRVVWRTYDDITDPDTRETLTRILAALAAQSARTEVGSAKTVPPLVIRARKPQDEGQKGGR